MSKLTVDRQAWYQALGYTPRLGQRLLDEAADAGKRYLSYFGFPRSGKSFHAAKHLGPCLLLPDFHAWIVAPTYQLGSKEFMYVVQDLVELGYLRLAKSVHTDVRGGNMSITFPWDAFLTVVSADNPASLRAEELDIVIPAEAALLPQDILERHLYARVAKRHGKFLVPTTPKGYNWLHEKFRVPSLPTIHTEYGPWHGGVRERLGGIPNPQYDPLYWSIVVSAIPDFGDVLEEGVYDKETVDRARRAMSPEIFKEQFGGDFSSYAGLIYHFDPRVHECEPFTIPDDWTHIVGYDHGATTHDPTAILFGSYDREGVLYWWNEVYTQGKSAVEYAGLIRNILGPTRTPSAVVIDPSARQVRIELARVGLTTTIPHDKQIEARITRMTSLLREGKMRVFRGACPNMVREILGWEWDEKQPGKPRAGQSDHALDAAGYATLATVRLPHEEAPDPDRILKEVEEDWTSFKLRERAWKPIKKQWRLEQEQKDFESLQDTVNDNPFEEEGWREQEFVFDV